MIQAEEAIHPDQLAPAKVANRVIIYYPRGQKDTILGWLCDKFNPHLVVDVLAEENGFFQWFQDASGNLVNPTDRTDGPPCKLVSFKL